MPFKTKEARSAYNKRYYQAHKKIINRRSTAWAKNNAERNRELKRLRQRKYRSDKAAKEKSNAGAVVAEPTAPKPTRKRKDSAGGARPD